MSTGGHFAWTDYRDLFAKARRDLERVRDRPNLDDLFNLLCTANHVSDWIYSDPSASAAVKKDVESLKQKPNSETSAVRQLCNGAKHLKAPTPRRRSRPMHWFERTFAKVRVSPRVPLAPYEVRYLVEIGGVERDLLEVVDAALTEWVALLRKHGLKTP